MMALATILVVDDEPMILDKLGAVIADFGQIPVMAQDGSTARVKLHESAPDLVLTDLKLPDTNGIALLKEIKSWDRQIPVAIITGFATVNTAIQAIKNGAYDYLTKPFKLVELEKVIYKGLRLRAGFRNPALVAPFLTQTLRFDIPSEVALIEGVMTSVSRCLENAAVYRDNVIQDVCLCVEEALVNAMLHGNGMKPNRRVHLFMEIAPDTLRMTVEDEGDGFDFSRYTDEKELEAIMALGGHGLFLIYCLMDEVAFNERGNVITFIKQTQTAGETVN